MIRRPPRSTLFPTRRSSDLGRKLAIEKASGTAILSRLSHSTTTAAVEARRTSSDRATPVSSGPGSDGRSRDRKSTRLNSSHSQISYAVFCLKKKKTEHAGTRVNTSHGNIADGALHQRARHLDELEVDHQTVRAHDHRIYPRRVRIGVIIDAD